MTNRSADSPDDLAAKYRRSKIANVVLAALSAFLLVVVVAQLSTAQPAPNADGGAASPPQQAAAGVETRDPDDPMALGAADAPVVLVEWTDLRCPYCAVFNRDTLPALVREYVDSGKLRIEIRDVSFFGEKSATAAVAARAAGNQGMFPEYLGAVYRVAPESGHPDLPRDRLIGFAKEIGVPDLAKFTADLDDPRLLDAVQQSTGDAQRLGVNSVPFFAIGNSALSGAQPIENFREFVDSALAGGK
ncbi:thioredoxin domain-containing protein [Saccharopolyspora sp. NPDC047091]|uniref:DsbA family protein n=1 Tax=Saccharopolyspora sp. NPDC047091 TaxID=3155924 RepID=UPI0033FE1BCD